MVELIGFIFFIVAVIAGGVLYFKLMTNSNVTVEMNNSNVSTLKTLDDYSNDLINIAHRRAKADLIVDVTTKIIEIKSIDDELIRISKRLSAQDRSMCG